MNIAQTSPVCNRETKLTDSLLGKGNLIPHIWYHKILRSNGKPDTVGISILSELSYLYRSSKTGEREFQLGHTYFKNKFNFTLNQIYEALVRLEANGLITRNERSTMIDGRRHGNELFITLNIEKLVLLCSSTEESKESLIRGNILEPIEETSSNPPRKYPCTSQGNIPVPLEEISSMYIDKKDLKKDNSYSYSYSKSNCDEREEKHGVAKKLPPVIPKANLYYNEKRSLKKFHPIGEEDGRLLCKVSERDFDLDYINDLLLKLSVKNPKHSFHSKEIFMCYMAKILKGELMSNEQATQYPSTAHTAAISPQVEASVIDQTTPWGKIRAALRNHYGKTGDALDKAWFGKLVPLESSDSNKLALKAPTNFICDYIEQHYLHTIEKLCSAQKYSFSLTV